MATSRPLRLLLFVALIGLALFQLRLALVAQSSYSGQTPSKAVRKYQTQPRLLVAYGREALFAQGNLKEVEQWYRRALEANPFYIPAWIALAELCNDEGDSDRAGAILAYVDNLMQDTGLWRWDKAMLAYQLGREDILRQDLTWLVGQEKVSGQTRKKALKLAFSLWPDPDELVHNMGRGNILPMFLHAVRSNNLAVADALWPRLDPAQLTEREILTYINRLINNREIEFAAGIWKKFYPANQLLYNGNFSAAPLQSGFGWRIGKAAGSTSQVNTLDGWLVIRFDGTRNLNFYHVRQIVAVSPGHSYRLSGTMQSSGLSTEQRPFVEVAGLQCSMPAARSTMAEENQDWTSFQIEFTVPQTCRAVQVRLRRRKSRNIDNLIHGELRLKDLQLQDITDQESISISTLVLNPARADRSSQ